MIDFKMTNKGDLIIEEQEKISIFNMKFTISSNPVFRMQMKNNTSFKHQQEEKKNNRIKVNFYTSKDDTGYTLEPVFNERELRQRIMLKLRTEKGDIISWKSFGSNISLVKHDDITSEKTKEKVKDIVMHEVSSILENPKIIVKHETIDGPFFCQNLTVYIYENDKEIYTFTIEG